MSINNSETFLRELLAEKMIGGMERAAALSALDDLETETAGSRGTSGI